jgi:hypothetical protein
VKHRGRRSSDDIFDLVFVEDLEQCFDIRLLPFPLNAPIPGSSFRWLCGWRLWSIRSCYCAA